MQLEEASKKDSTFIAEKGLYGIPLATKRNGCPMNYCSSLIRLINFLYVKSFQSLDGV